MRTRRREIGYELSKIFTRKWSTPNLRRRRYLAALALSASAWAQEGTGFGKIDITAEKIR
jgi:hypothetical protein